MRRSRARTDGAQERRAHRPTDGAQERTRTFTAVKPLAPEASASTNSATWARSVGSREAASLKPRLPPVNGVAAMRRSRAPHRIAAPGGIVYRQGHAEPRHRLRRIRLHRRARPCAQLAKAGWRIRVAVRNPAAAYAMRLHGDVGQIDIVQANVRNAPLAAPGAGRARRRRSTWWR